MQNLHMKFTIYRVSFIDDEVGGAVETGTVLASNIRGYMDIRPPSQLMLEQGLETPRIADIFLRPRPGSLVLYERDQIEVTGPADHPNINERWRIEAVLNSPQHPKDRKRFIKVRTTRVDRTRTREIM